MGDEPKRRKFQFRFATLFWAITVAAVCAYAFKERSKRLGLERSIQWQKIELDDARENNYRLHAYIEKIENGKSP